MRSGAIKAYRRARLSPKRIDRGPSVPSNGAISLFLQAYGHFAAVFLYEFRQIRWTHAALTVAGYGISDEQRVAKSDLSRTPKNLVMHHLPVCRAYKSRNMLIDDHQAIRRAPSPKQSLAPVDYQQPLKGIRVLTLWAPAGSYPFVRG